MQAMGVTLSTWKKCKRKKRYRKCTMALKHLDKLNSKGHDVHAYECPICGYWHVGHKNLYPPDCGQQ